MNTIKDYLIAILAFAAAVMAALFYKSKAKYESAMRKGQEQVIETERKATNALVKGKDRERKARNDAKNAIINRNYFG